MFGGGSFLLAAVGVTGIGGLVGMWWVGDCSDRTRAVLTLLFLAGWLIFLANSAVALFLLFVVDVFMWWTIFG